MIVLPFVILPYVILPYYVILNYALVPKEKVNTIILRDNYI